MKYQASLLSVQLLSATIGTGNIVGVATAIGCTALGTAVGGPGALFWMLGSSIRRNGNKIR